MKRWMTLLLAGAMLAGCSRAPAAAPGVSLTVELKTPAWQPHPLSKGEFYVPTAQVVVRNGGAAVARSADLAAR